jgi:CRP-like cAMP-binding protein
MVIGRSMATAILTAASYAPGGALTREYGIAKRVITLCASPLFTGLSMRECAQIASIASERFFERNQPLFMQGQPARHLMMIRAGSVKVSQLSRNGEEAVLLMTGPGDPLGMLTEALSQTYTCTASAMAPTIALVWEYARLQGLIPEIPQISQILTSRLEELQERFREVATEKVAPRVAKALMRLVKQVGRPVRGGIEISLSREELAQMTGTTLFTTSRLLAKWGGEGFIQPRREAVVVLDALRLEQVSCLEG